MSDIEASIRGWKKSLVEREGMRAEHADELEDHLREEIARMKDAALSEEEMFLVASDRLGRPEVLAAELERAEPLAVWRKRWIWMLAGYLGLTTASVVIHCVEILAEWLSRDHSRIFVMGASVAALLVCLAIVVLIARHVSRTWSRSRDSKRSMAFEKPVGLIGLAIVAIALVFGSLYGGLLLEVNLPWRADQTRLEYTTTFKWIVRVFTAFVPVAVLCALLWMDSRRKQDRNEVGETDPRPVWRQRWIWMLSGYVLLGIAWTMIRNAQSLAQWFSRTQSVTVVNIAALATYALGIAGVVWLARWSVRTRAASDGSTWRPFVGTRRGVVGLAVVGLVVEWLVVYGSWLGYQQLDWAPGDTRASFDGWVGWTLLVVNVAGVPVAALCTLLWLDRRREQGDSRTDRIEA